MGRWALFFAFMFSICTYLASVAEGGGGIAVTYLTADVTATEIGHIHVAATGDFLGASHAYPAYIVIGDEILTYEDKTSSIQFSTLARGQSDPTSSTAATTPAIHHAGDKVRTIAVGAMDSFMNQQITSSTAGFGAFQAFTFVGKMFTNMPKFLAWNYSFLSGPMVFLKYFILYPLSIGFVFCIGGYFLALGMGLFKL